MNEAMSGDLLQTKLYVPRLRPLLIPRPHLIKKLNRGLQQGCKLTLVSAPAGFGKTTLATDWLSQTERPFTWLSLDEDDNDLTRFFTYAAAAVQQIEGVGNSVQSLLQSPQPTPLKSLATAFINDSTAVPTPFILALDDYHVITETAVNEAVAFLLDNLPPHLHLVIASRTDPLLPLPRLRARGQMTELRTDSLRFTAQEAARFLQQMMGLALSDKAVSALETRTEGWIAGLQMAALSLQGLKSDAEIAAFVADFTGSHRYIFDYLTDEVLRKRPFGTIEFLLQTSILDRLSGPLCNAVTGMNKSQSLLEELDEANLFIVPLDNNRHWYRYHHLFADLLRHRLRQKEGDVISHLHIRACDWFLHNNLMPEAVHHALAAKDNAQASHVITLAAPGALNDGNYATLLNWIEALPAHFVVNNPELSTYFIWALFLMGKNEEAFRYADLVEGQLPTDTPATIRGRITALHAYKQDLSRDPVTTSRLALEALQLLEESDAFFRMRTLILVGHAKLMQGDVTGTEDYRQAIQLGQRHNNPFAVFVGTNYLTRALYIGGHRQAALEANQYALEWYKTREGPESPFISYAYTGLGYLHYAANKLTTAETYLRRGLTLSQSLGPLAWSNATAKEYLAYLQCINGDAEMARATVADMVQKIKEVGLPETTVQLELREANLLLRIGDVDGAARMIANTNMHVPTSLLPHHEKVHDYIIYCRSLLAQNQPQQALKILVQLEEIASKKGWYRYLINTHILQAQAFQASADEKTALVHLEKAVRLAAPENWQRIFLDENEDIAVLLPSLRPVAPAFIDDLCVAFGVTSPPPVPPLLITQLQEPLSEREMDVLRLLVTHLSGPEIAERLFISTNTFKTHTKNIYSKLNVRSRGTAVSRAQDLGLLS
ncbi:MAG: hypothetical protein GY805_32130 [Chloroflexi bacterium]|nr:hypothetical protein [Chloroflexota bacterium]